MSGYALAVLTAALLVLAFPSLDIAALAPVALVPLLFVLSREHRPARRFLLGYATGVVYWFGICYWIAFTLANYAGVNLATGWALFVLFCLAKAVQMGIFGWLAGMLTGRAYAVPAIAALWVVLEWTHTHTGFAWLTLGNAAIDLPLLPRMAPWTGVYGISFILALTAAALALRRFVWLLPLLALPLIPRLPSPDPGTATALAVQPNLPQDETWTPASLARMETRLAELSVPSRPVQMVVWPEAPAPIYDSDVGLPRIALRAGAPFLTGAVSHTDQGEPLNSALLISKEGRFLSRYDKVNLVPFGEFVPWPFGAITKKISSEVGDYAPGRGLVVAGGIGTFICYESVFPDYIRRFALGGAEVLFNLSNDGWFGKTSARFQHFQIVRMRAVENARWIVRVTNNGITASIDPAGRTLNVAPSYIETAVLEPYSYRQELTFYTRHGDWFVLVSALGLVGILIPGARAMRKS